MTRPAAKSQLTQPKAPMLSFLGRGKGGEAPEPSSQPMDTSEVSLADAERVTLRCEAVLEGHGADEVGVARVWHCAWDPAGKTLATCSSDKTCRIWAKSAAAGNSWVTVAELEGVHSRTVRQAAWSPCGRLLATASFDASTAVWAQQGGEWECVAVVEGHENEVKSCAWSPSGSLLATCGRDKSVWIWEVQPGHDFECVAVLNGHTQDVKQVLWHPTEDSLVSVSYDDSIKVWTEDPGGDDWSCAQTLTKEEGGHTSTVWCASFEPTGGFKRLATCSDDRTIGIWDVDAGRGLALSSVANFPCGHDRPALSVSWGKCGLLAEGGGDDSVRLFAPPRSVQEGAEEGADTAVVGSEGKAWVEIGRVLSFHEHEGEGESTDGHEDEVNCVAWHPTEPHTLATASDDGTVKIWSVHRAESPGAE